MFLSCTLIDNIFDRLMLAALHFNENGMREQATTKEGKKRYDVVFPKFKKRGYTIREVKVECTFGKVIQYRNLSVKFDYP